MENVSLVDGHIDNGLSDEDIIKALECCKEARLNQDCLDLKCPFSTEYGCNIDEEDLRNEALDLINRQKAEIESLKHRKTELQIRNQELQHEKSEAIKEFAERLRAESYLNDGVFYIDKIVKEMIGEQNE